MEPHVIKYIVETYGNLTTFCSLLRYCSMSLNRNENKNTLEELFR